MLINKYLIIKFLKSYSVCVSIFFICFFVFSLLNHLDDNFEIKRLFILSTLSTFQIFLIIPEFIFFFSVLLFWINIKSKLELFIARQYISLITIIKFFFPFIFLYTILIFYKGGFSEILNERIDQIAKQNYMHKIKLIIDRGKSGNTYYLFKNINAKNNSLEEYNTFITKNNSIYYADYSSGSTFNNNHIISQSKYSFENNNFVNSIKKENNIEDLEQILKGNKLVYNLKPKLLITLMNFINFIFFTIFLICITIIFYSRKYLTIKSISYPPILLSIFLIIYSYIINNLSLEKFNLALNLLSILFLLIVLLKHYRYE